MFLVGAMGPGQTRHELNLIEAATAAGVSRVVKLSVWRADEELTPIARAAAHVLTTDGHDGRVHALTGPRR